MRSFVLKGVMSAAVLGLLAAGGCASVGTVGPAAMHDPARMNYLYKVSSQLDQMQTRVASIQANLDEMGGQTRTHLADKLATVRLDIIAAQHDLTELRHADDGAQWKQDQGHLKTVINQMDSSLKQVDQAMRKA